MESDLVLDAARGVHLIGLAIGLGVAFCAEIVAARSVFVPVTRRDVWCLTWLHRVVLTGLLILWVSGLFLLRERTGWEPEAFSPKLTAKLTAVSLLCVNGLIIGAWALPVYRMHEGMRLGAFPLGDRIRLSAIAGLSLTCWIGAMVMGVFSRLKEMGWPELQAVLVPIAMFGFSVAVLVGVGATLVEQLNRLARRLRGRHRVRRPYAPVYHPNRTIN